MRLNYFACVFYLFVLASIALFCVRKFDLADKVIYLDPPKNYTGQIFKAECPECHTIFSKSWDGRKCPECEVKLKRLKNGI